MSEAGRIRLLAIGLLAGFVIFGAALMSVPLLIREPLPVVRPGSAISFTLGAEHAAGRLQVDQAGAFVLEMGISRSDMGATDAPSIQITHHEGARLAPTMEPVAAGRYRAAGRLELPGQWRIALAGHAEHSFTFVLAEF